MVSLNRLDWVDIAKALSITLVVIMYATYSTGEATGATGFMHWVVAFTAPLRMPEFFLISGLFLSRAITRDWRNYADRRIVHYLYFFFLWSVILITLKVAIFAGDPVAAAGNLLAIPYAPYSALWFIYALAIFSTLTKLFHTAKVPVWLVLALGVALNLAPIPLGSHALVFLGELADYFVFFVAGYAFAPHIFKLVETLTAKPLIGVAVLGAWALLNAALVFSPGFTLEPVSSQMGLAALPIIRLPLAFSGALAVCVGAGLLARTPLRAPLSYMGARVLVIYLSFLIPMGIAREVLLRTGLFDTGQLSLIIVVLALIAPLIVELFIAKTGLGRFFFTRPKWAYLTQRNEQPKATAIPAE